MPDNQSIHQILTQFWGFTSFREKQEDIINAVLNHQDTLALLPTGGGKSVCFQVPALTMEGICLVISPLIALMQDQVENLKSKGIKALAINAGLSKREIDIALDNAAYGGFKFLYVSPERLETELFQARLKKMNVNLVAVDEAHCISQWGYDFRPAYLNIAKLREQLPEVPFLALTATATPKVVDDIQEKLEFKRKNVIQKSFLRNNLAYVVLKEQNQLQRMLKVIDGVKGSGIVYVSSRKRTKQVAQFLLEHRISADYYHAGLGFEERKKKQGDWIENKTGIIVSTNAFGMGIDKPNVRFVIHLDLPESLEAYFQEAGRAGRDGKKAFAVLLMSPSMGNDLRKKVEQSFPSIEEIKRCYLALANYLQLPINSGENETFSLDIVDFSQRYKLNIFNCYLCLHFLEKEEYLSISENFSMPSRLHLRLKKEDVYKFQVSHKKYDSFIKMLLRTYGGLYDDFVKIKESELAKNFDTSTDKIVSTLDRLQELEVVDYEKQSNLPKITFLKPRLAQEAVRISKKNYLDRKENAQEKLDAILHYAESEHSCRSRLLLSYFGESESKRCGICDVCLMRNKLDLSDLEYKKLVKEITEILKGKRLSLEKIALQLKSIKEEKLLKVISFEMDAGTIESDGFLYWIE